VTARTYWNVADLLPYNTQQGGPVTREFLLKVIEVLLEFVRQTNDRNCKVLDFRHPEEMRRLLDLDLPDRPVTLQQLIDDCCLTLKYQVKTGMWRNLTAAPVLPKMAQANLSMRFSKFPPCHLN
jgi:hypothetical protein